VPGDRAFYETSYRDWEFSARARPVVEEQRLGRRTNVLGSGTLACRRCDAPVAPSAQALHLNDAIACPYCAHSGVVRDFLSLAAPTRPARVLVRVSGRAGA
jgi:DNA-directed RNA polymerase subunit RPC12/RpoP